MRRWGRGVPEGPVRGCCTPPYGLHFGKAVVCGPSADLPSVSPAAVGRRGCLGLREGCWCRPWARGRGVKQSGNQAGRQASRDGNVKEASRHYTGFSACGCGPGVPQDLCRHGSGSARGLSVFLSFPQASKKSGVKV